jgi:putative NADPH-quinone reductase
MNVLIVFDHPYKKSYCSAILESVKKGLKQAGHQIDLIDLVEDGFDPVMHEQDLEAYVIALNNPEKANKLLSPQVKEYKERLNKAQHIIFIFPIWWALMPALTKGFIDKLIFPGFAYEFNKKGTRLIGKLKNLQAVTMITTMNTPRFIYSTLMGNAIKKALLFNTFWNLGIKKRKWISLNMVKFVSQEKRVKWLASIENKFSKL